MKKTAIFTALAMLALAGCSATLPVQSGGLIQKNTGKKVTAKVSSVNVLGFNPISLETTSGLLDSLQTQCGNSKVTGITAVNRNTFLFLANIEAVEASGYCAN